MKINCKKFSNNQNLSNKGQIRDTITVTLK